MAKKYEYEFIPKVAQGEEASFKGVMLLRVPSLSERYFFTDETELEVDEIKSIADDLKVAKDTKSSEEEKDVATTSAKKKIRGQLRKLGRCIDEIEKFILKVELEHKEEGEKFDCYADLTHDDRCSFILLELVALFNRGFRPSKNLKP